LNRSVVAYAAQRLVLPNREHVIALEPLRDDWNAATLSIRPAPQREHFDGIQDAKSPTYVDLAKHIVNLKAEHF